MDEPQGGTAFLTTSTRLHRASTVYRYLSSDTSIPLPLSSGGYPTLDLEPYANPHEWPKSRKIYTMCLSCIAAASSTYAAGSYSACAVAMSKEWGISEVKVFLGITTFCIGYAIAPMTFASFSEINGRYPVFLSTGIIWVGALICCATTGSYVGMLFWRFWTGIGSSAFSTVVGGVISDLYLIDDRAIPMALFAGASTFGMGLGPLVSGLFTNWRWSIWLQVITCGILVAAFAIFFKETRGTVLLRRKARALNRYYDECEQSEIFQQQRMRWKVHSDEHHQSVTRVLRISVCRPFRLLFTEWIIILFSLWLSFAWAILYLSFGSVPRLFITSRHFTSRQSSAVFSAICVGSVISSSISILRESIFRPASTWVQPKRIAEAYLYSSCTECLLLPIGLLWLGWTQDEHIPWIVPVLAVGCVAMGINSVYLAAINYLTRIYGEYTSSALAVQSFCRTMLGGLFAPIAAVMFGKLTIPGTLSLLSGLSLVLATVPLDVDILWP